MKSLRSVALALFGLAVVGRADRRRQRRQLAEAKAVRRPKWIGSAEWLVTDNALGKDDGDDGAEPWAGNPDWWKSC